MCAIYFYKLSFYMHLQYLFKSHVFVYNDILNHMFTDSVMHSLLGHVHVWVQKGSLLFSAIFMMLAEFSKPYFPCHFYLQLVILFFYFFIHVISHSPTVIMSYISTLATEWSLVGLNSCSNQGNMNLWHELWSKNHVDKKKKK